MASITANLSTSLNGSIKIAGDKSISHRAIMLASICNGESIIANVPDSEDINSTISALRNCGISIKKDNYQQNKENESSVISSMQGKPFKDKSNKKP